MNPQKTNSRRPFTFERAPFLKVCVLLTLLAPIIANAQRIYLENDGPCPTLQFDLEGYCPNESRWRLIVGQCSQIGAGAHTFVDPVCTSAVRMKVWTGSCENSPSYYVNVDSSHVAPVTVHDFPLSCPGVDDASNGKPDDCKKCCGMPVWSVAEPYINLWIRDEPLGYQPASGPRVSFEIAYKHRGLSGGHDDNVFGVGKGWNFSWLSSVYLDYVSGPNVVAYADGRIRKFSSLQDFVTNTRLSGNSVTNFTVSNPDGSKDVYGFFLTNNTGAFVKAFLSEHYDASNQKLTFTYSADIPSQVTRLLQVVDNDGKTNLVHYATNGYSTNLITSVDDPYGRSARFSYDANGYLTSVTDTMGITNYFQYESHGYVQSMATPYGTNTFAYATNYNLANGRWIRVSEPDGGWHLFLSTNNAPGVAPSYSSGELPNTSPFANSFENANLDSYNTFHWAPRQYANLSTTNIGSLTSNDFRKASMKHWLRSLYPAGTAVMGQTLSLSRDPSPDAGGTIEGQKTWYDYAGKTNGSYEGTQPLPLFVGQVFPDGSSSFTRTVRNSLGAVTNEVSTFSVAGSALLRTNVYLYSANEVDLLAATNALGFLQSSNIYNAYHRVTTNYNALLEPTVFTYNANQELTSVTRPSGLITTNIYDSSTGLLLTTYDYSVNGGSPIYYRTNSYTYINTLIYSHTDERGLTVTNTWDALERLRSMRFPDGTYTSNNFTALDITDTRDRLGNWTHFGFDSMRRKVAETNALGFYSTYSYCNCGALDSMRDREGNLTYFYYNNQGRLTNIFYPDSFSVTNYLDLLGRVVATTESGGHATTNFYNNQGLLESVSNVLGRVQFTLYDALDRATNTVDADNVSISSSFDKLNRVVARTYPDTGVEGFGYTSGVGPATSYTNQISKVWRYGFDPLSRKIAETNANLEVLQFSYSAGSDLLALTDGKNQTTQWHYDEYGRVTNKLDQASVEILRYSYDADSRLTNRWSIEKGNTGYTFDSVGNLTNVDYATGSDVHFAYDGMNRRTNMVDGIGTTAWRYNPAGQVLAETGPFSNCELTNSYANRNRVGLHLEQVTGAWTNGFGYDAADRLSLVSSPNGTFNYTYPSSGVRSRPRLLSLPNGASITNAFDSSARLTTTSLNDSGNAPIDFYFYQYNLANQRTNVVRPGPTAVEYSYDSIGQLTNAYAPYSPSENRGYAYDKAWNLTNRNANGNVSAFGVDVKNQLASQPSGSCSYDANGNLTNNAGQLMSYDCENRLVSWVAGGPTLGTPGTAFYYDGLGRLRTRTEYLGDGSSWILQKTVSYIYDGMRVIQERDAYNNPSASYTRGIDLSGSMEGAGGIGGLLARSIYFPQCSTNLTVRITNNTPDTLTGITIFDSLNAYVMDQTIDPYSFADFAFQGVGGNEYTIFGYGDYYYLPYVGESFTPLLNYFQYEANFDETHRFSDGMVLCGADSTTMVNYYFCDGNGNITYMMDGAQQMVAQYRYDPFGNTIWQDGPLADNNVYRFSSKEFHVASGMYHYGYRFYEPSLQRWVNRDPIEEIGFKVALTAAEVIPFEGDWPNLYAFVLNNAVGFTDALGLEVYKSCAEDKSQGGFRQTRSVATGKRIALPFGGGYADEMRVVQRKCSFRCYHKDAENCYKIPCPSETCQKEKDHGVSILVIINATGSGAAATCSEVADEVRTGKLTGGSIARNHRQMTW